MTLVPTSMLLAGAKQIFVRLVTLYPSISPFISLSYTVFGILDSNIADSILSPIKLKLKVPLVTHEQCLHAFKQQMLNIGPGQICAGGETDRDSCPGDSGSPLMNFDPVTNRWIVVGLVSMGLKECGVKGIPGVYTKIDMYLDWIEANAK